MILTTRLDVTQLLTKRSEKISNPKTLEQLLLDRNRNNRSISSGIQIANCKYLFSKSTTLALSQFATRNSQHLLFSVSSSNACVTIRMRNDAAAVCYWDTICGIVSKASGQIKQKAAFTPQFGFHILFRRPFVSPAGGAHSKYVTSWLMFAHNSRGSLVVG